MKKLSVTILVTALLVAIFSLPIMVNAESEDKNESLTNVDTVPVGYIEISDTQELYDIRLDPSLNYILMNDIVFTEAEFEAGGAFYNLGYGWNAIKDFSGILDGNSYSIKGLYINNTRQTTHVEALEYKIDMPDEWFNGLIRNATSTSVIKNIKLEEADITIAGYDSSPPGDTNYEIGGIVGRSYGNIEDCSFAGKIVLDFHAGIIPWNYQVPRVVGGICGAMYTNVSGGQNFKNCINKGTISNNNDGKTGGVLGEISLMGDSPGVKTIDITNCTNEGVVTGNGLVGGVVGSAWLLGTASGLENSGTVNQIHKEPTFTYQVPYRANSYAGGIFGYANCSKTYVTKQSIIIDCKNTGRINSVSKAGGIVGDSKVDVIENCVNSGKINVVPPNLIDIFKSGSLPYPEDWSFDRTATLIAAGIAATANGNIKNCTNSGKTFLNDSLVSKSYSYFLHPKISAGIAGAFGGTIVGCINNADIKIVGGKIAGSSDEISSLYAAGIVGSQGSGFIENCVNKGKIITDGAKGELYLGGIAASFIANRGYSEQGNIKQGIFKCKNEVDITATSDTALIMAGGIVAIFSGDFHETKATLTECANDGKMTITAKAEARMVVAKYRLESFAGGIVGKVIGGGGFAEVTKCVITKPVEIIGVSYPTADYATVSAGGIAGELSATSPYFGGALVSDCINTQIITAIGYRANAGGIVGSTDGAAVGRHTQGYDLYNSTVIINCENNAKILAYNLNSGAPTESIIVTYAGGIAGSGGNLDILDSKNSGEISAPTAGGLVGYLAGGHVVSCLNTGKISGISNDRDEKNYAKGNVYAGGIIGQGFAYPNNYSGGSVSIEKCENTGTVSADIDGFPAIFSNNYEYQATVGGIIGSLNASNSGAANIDQCLNSGSVSGTSTITMPFHNMGVFSVVAGGIHGWASKTGKYSALEVTNCYNIGNISAEAANSIVRVGGIAGSTGEMSNCYNLGKVEVKNRAAVNGDYLGGVIGVGYNDTKNLYYCYGDKGIGYTTPGSGTKATKLTVAQMRDRSSFTGFDFTNIWAMQVGDSPYLKSIGYRKTELEDPAMLPSLVVSLSVTTPTVIKITWDAITNANKYELYRATSENGTYTMLYSGTALSFTNSKLKPGTTYYFKAKALHANPDNNSAFSIVQSIKLLPKTPGSFKIKKSGTTIKSTWGAVVGASGYTLEISTKPTSGFKSIYSGSKRAFSKTKLKKGKTYYFRVRAYVKSGGKKVYGPYAIVKFVKI